MVTNLGNKLGVWLYKNLYIKENEIDKVRFVIEVLCTEIFEFSFILLLGILIKELVPTIFMIFTFRSLREQYKGYHAATPEKCIFITLSVFMLCISIYKYIPSEVIIIINTISVIYQLYCIFIYNSVNSLLVSISICILGLVLSNKYKMIINVYIVIKFIVLLSHLILNKKR